MEKTETNTNLTARNGASEIRQRLEEQKSIIGRDSNNTVDKIIASMRTDEMYTEPYEREQFLIVPLDRREQLTQNIRRDLHDPLRYLLMVEDTSGRIRKGSIILFYPEDVSLPRLPGNSFHDFFINQTFRVEGTFSMISLMDIKQYEMDFDANGSRKEFRLWYGKPTITEPAPNQPICIDWYLTTTIYYSDGSTQYYEEFLYTQCYENPDGGGGGGVYSPVSNEEGEPFVKLVTFNVKSGDVNTYIVEYWYEVTGKKFTNSSSNYYTSISGADGHNGGVFLMGVTSVPSNINYCTWQQTLSTYQLSNYIPNQNELRAKSFNAQVNGILTFPNQSPPNNDVYNSNSWNASTEN